jgi:hypothetical protein
MVFCGTCGKKATNEQKFCTHCGTQIVETAVSVAEEVGEIIKEEYRSNETPLTADIGRGTHIGDQKRSGEWLEAITENILKFAGFRTTRQFAIPIDDKNKDKFFVDVLATDSNIEIFVECKDYQDLKMDEKIMFSFIGQINHYRKNQNKRIIGVLAMTARDDGRNSAIRERLREDGCFLWDGSFIEYLQNKMTEFENKADFRLYLLNHMDAVPSPEIRKEKDGISFVVRYSFYTIRPNDYIGKKFDIMNIVDDVKKGISQYPIKLINHVIESILTEDGKILIRYKINLDFEVSISKKTLREFENENKGFWNTLRRKNPQVEIQRRFINGIYGILTNIYGINYVRGSRSQFESIYYSGGRFN